MLTNTKEQGAVTCTHASQKISKGPESVSVSGLSASLFCLRRKQSRNPDYGNRGN